MAAENLDLDINLPGEEFARQAKRMQEELKKISGVAFDVQKSLKFSISGAVGDFGRMRISASAAASSLKKGVSEADRWAKDFAKSWGRIGMAAFRDAGKEAKKEHDAFANMWGKIGMQYFKDSAKRLDKSNKQLTASGIAFANLMKDTAVGFIRTITNGIKDLIEDSAREIAKQQKVNIAYALALGPEKGRAMQEDVRRYSKLLPYTQQELSPKFLELQQSGFNPRTARNIIALGADVAARQGKERNIQNLQPVIDFAETMHAREGFRRNQLDLILKPLGKTEGDFFTELSKIRGENIETTKKKALKGGDAKFSDQALDVLFTMGEMANKERGLAPTLGAAGNVESKDLESAWDKLKNLPNDFSTELSKNLTTGSIADSLNKIIKNLSPESESGKGILEELQTQMARLATWAEQNITKDNIEKIGDAIATLPGKLAEMAASIDRFSGVIETLLPHKAPKDIVLPDGTPGVEMGRHDAKVLEEYERKKKQKRESELLDAETGSKKKGLTDRFFDYISSAISGGPTDAEVDAYRMKRYREASGTRPGEIPPQAITKGAGGVTVHQNNEINLTGAPGDDQNHTAQVIGRTVKDQTLRGLEQARQQTGN